uniref:Putative conserved secreted protein n=1 Tax=Anopheles triannulatus TaxID=58253 RepID=A0A2M4AD90_9DIPT
MAQPPHPSGLSIVVQCVALSLLLLFLMHNVLYSRTNAQTFGSLKRHRGESQTTPASSTTSQEELNDKIQTIYDPQYRSPAAVATGASSDGEKPTREDEEGQQSSVTSALTPRASHRARQPAGNTQPPTGTSLLTVYRGKNGELVPVFGPTTPSGTSDNQQQQQQQQQLVRHPVSSRKKINVLNIAVTSNSSSGKATYDFGTDSYPDDYPFQQIQEILEKKRDMYREVFDNTIQQEKLVTRIDSPTDGYLCSSHVAHKYPTYHRESNSYIVNVQDFYQGVTFDECDEVGALCSKTCDSISSRYECEQIYGQMEVLTVPRDATSWTFKRQTLSFPSSCKCKHIDLLAND